jgi:pilus assembly protein CpaC
VSTLLRTILARAFALAVAFSVALAPVALAASPQVITPTGRVISVSVGKGAILRLDRPVGNVFVADPNIADIQVKSPTIIYLLGKAAGATTLFALDKEDRVLINSPIEVHANAAELQRAIDQLVPGAQVAVRGVQDSIVLEGKVASAAEGDDIRKIAARYVPDQKQLVNKMQLVAPDQINLHVRIAEVKRSVEKQFGIDWQNAYNNGSVAFGLVTAGTSVIANTTATKVIPALPGSAVNGFNTQGTAIQGGATVNNIFGGIATGSKSINSLITALEDQGLITILAEPNLTAVSGQKASFLAGGEFPVPVPQSGTGGSAVVTIDYKQFGVTLSFIATILNDNRISLHVEPEVSQIDNSLAIQVAGVSVPGLSTRRAQTTVELASGQTFAIGGLMQNNVTQNLNKFPWLGDLPILGQLFRSEAFQRNESELVILVTPYIVNPVNTQMATPLDGLETPTDVDLIWGPHLNRPQSQAPDLPTQAPTPAAAAVTLPDGRKAATPTGQVGFEID